MSDDDQNRIQPAPAPNIWLPDNGLGVLGRLERDALEARLVPYIAEFPVIHRAGADPVSEFVFIRAEDPERGMAGPKAAAEWKQWFRTMRGVPDSAKFPHLGTAGGIMEIDMQDWYAFYGEAVKEAGKGKRKLFLHRLKRLDFVLSWCLEGWRPFASGYVPTAIKRKSSGGDSIVEVS